MNIAIFNHYVTDFYHSKERENFIGVLNYLKDIIDPKHKILIFDLLKNYKKEINLPKRLYYLKKYLQEDLTEYLFFNKYYQFGSKNNFNHKELIHFKPEVILISNFAFCYFNEFKECVEYFRKILKNVIIIVGGNGPSSEPLYYIKNSNIDYLVVGPAELSLNQLLDCIEKKIDISIPNVISKKNLYNYSIELNREYEFEPFITELNKKKVSLQLTRGCPKNCIYCSIKVLTGNKFLVSNIKKIKDKLINLNLIPPIHFYFEDDNITFKKDYFLEIVEYIKKKIKNFTFSLENGIDWQTLDISYIEQLINYGLKQLNISLTSIDSNILQEHNRNYTYEKFDYFISNLEKYDIPVIVYFICGLPNDNIENILNTILYLTTKKVILGISTFYPVPRTNIVKKIKKKLNAELCKGSSFYNWGNIKTKDLITFFILTRFINSIKKIDFLNIQYLKELIQNIKIKGNIILSKKNFSRREITIFGILYSIKKRKIFGIIKKNNFYILSSYKCNNKILKVFFKKIVTNTIIYTKYGKITPEVWKDIINLFQS